MATGKSKKRTAASAYPQIGPRGERPAPPELKIHRKNKLDTARAHWREAIARTRASQAEIDRYIKGVKLPKGPSVIWGEPRAVVEETDDLDAMPPRAPIRPPVDYDRDLVHQIAAQQPRAKDKVTPRDKAPTGLVTCTLCFKTGHNRRRHDHEPKCVHGIPWSTCRSCLRTASTASGPPGSQPTAP